MVETEPEYWNSPFYKPKTKIHPYAWDDFMRAAFTILYHQRQRIADPLDKDPNKYRELEVYDVFNWMRQENLGELPYNKKRIEKIDAQIEKEFARDARRRIGKTPK